MVWSMAKWYHVLFERIGEKFASPERILLLASGLLGTAAIVWVATEFSLLTPLHALIFSPLGGAAYLAFRNPESPHAQSKNLAFAMPLGAAFGYVFHHWLGFSPISLTLAVILTIFFMEAIDLTMPPAVGAAILLFIVPTSKLAYVVSITVMSLVLAGAFNLWRTHVYEPRDSLLYTSRKEGKCKVLCVLTKPGERATAEFAAEIADPDSGVLYLDVLHDQFSGEEFVNPRMEIDFAERVRILESLVEEVAKAHEIPVESEVLKRPRYKIPESVLRLASERKCSTILLGWGGPDSLPDHTLRRIISHANFDVLAVKEDEYQSNINDILVPLAPGTQHADLLVSSATTLASNHNAALHFLTVAPNEKKCMEAEAFHKRFQEAYASQLNNHPTSWRVLEGSVPQVIARESQKADLIVMGAPESTWIWNLLFPTTAQKLEEEPGVNCPIIVTKQGTIQ